MTCAAVATQDALIEVQDLGDVPMAAARMLPCRIDSIARVAADVVQVVLRLPPRAGFSFHPGQYIDVIGHGGVRRSYSIANASRPDERLELHVRKVPGGVMSDYWFERAKPNDMLRLHGPMGTSFLRGAAGLDLVFLATGTGIAPVKAMLEGLAQSRDDETSRPRSTSVYWGNRVPEDLYWNVESSATGVRFTPVLSRAGQSWGGRLGHIQQALLDDRPSMDSMAVYACGSEAMIRDARHALVAAGLAPHRFHADPFVASAS